MAIKTYYFRKNDRITSNTVQLPSAVKAIPLVILEYSIIFRLSLVEIYLEMTWA